MPYHHGNLREALVDAAWAAARAEGPDAVGLRAATRAAGVSPNAAYRHFADRDDLLRAVCERAMASLADLMRRRVTELPPAPDPVDGAWDRLTALGRAYIEFALAEPGLYRTAFGVPLSVEPLGSADPYQLLVDSLDGLLAVGALTPERRDRAEYAAWSAVHGLSSLLVDGPLRGLPAEEREAAIDKVVTTVRTGL